MSTKALQTRIEELEKLTLVLSEKIKEFDAKPVAKNEASTDKKVKATSLKKDGQEEGAPRMARGGRWSTSGVHMHIEHSG